MQLQCCRRNNTHGKTNMYEFDKNLQVKPKLLSGRQNNMLFVHPIFQYVMFHQDEMNHYKNLRIK